MTTIPLVIFHQLSGHELFIDKMETSIVPGAYWSSFITLYLKLRPPNKTYMCLTPRVSHTAI